MWPHSGSCCSPAERSNGQRCRSQDGQCHLVPPVNHSHCTASTLSPAQLLMVAWHWLPCQGKVRGRICDWLATNRQQTTRLKKTRPYEADSLEPAAMKALRRISRAGWVCHKLGVEQGLLLCMCNLICSSWQLSQHCRRTARSKDCRVTRATTLCSLPSSFFFLACSSLPPSLSMALSILSLIVSPVALPSLSTVALETSSPVCSFMSHLVWCLSGSSCHRPLADTLWDRYDCIC